MLKKLKHLLIQNRLFIEIRDEQSSNRKVFLRNKSIRDNRDNGLGRYGIRKMSILFILFSLQQFYFSRYVKLLFPFNNSVTLMNNIKVNNFIQNSYVDMFIYFV